MFIVVVITRQPENTTACRGSEVIITCGHNSITPLFDTIWSINGSDFRSIKDDPLYRANNQTLIIVSIDYTTTFRCSVQILQSQPPIVLTSTIGTVIVVGMYKCIYICTYMVIYVHNCRLCMGCKHTSIHNALYIHTYIHTYVYTT